MNNRKVTKNKLPEIIPKRRGESKQKYEGK